MNIKVKNIFTRLSFRKLVIYLNISLVIVFLIIFFLIGNFVNNNVYKVILIEDVIIIDQTMMSSLIVNLNVNKFESIIKSIEKKVIPRKMENFKNIFR